MVGPIGIRLIRHLNKIYEFVLKRVLEKADAIYYVYITSWRDHASFAQNISDPLGTL